MKTFILTKEQIESAQALAQKIKDSKPYTANWNIDNITVGLLGEVAYGMMTGMDMNTQVWNDRCDSGIDFPDGANVKTTTYAGPSPELKISRIPDFSKVTKYIMAVCDYKKHPEQVFLIGEISFDNFK